MRISTPCGADTPLPVAFMLEPFFQMQGARLARVRSTQLKAAYCRRFANEVQCQLNARQALVSLVPGTGTVPDDFKFTTLLRTKRISASKAYAAAALLAYTDAPKFNECRATRASRSLGLYCVSRI